jgi:hypothetical protein
MTLQEQGENVVDFARAERALVDQPAERMVLAGFTRTVVEVQRLVHHLMDSDVDPVPKADVLNQLALVAKLVLEANHRYLSAWAERLAASPSAGRTEDRT